MGRLLIGIILPLFCRAGCVQAAEKASGSPGPDADIIVWVLGGIFVFFAIVVAFTWYLIKGERKRPKKPPE